MTLSPTNRTPSGDLVCMSRPFRCLQIIMAKAYPNPCTVLLFRLGGTFPIPCTVFWCSCFRLISVLVLSSQSSGFQEEKLEGTADATLGPVSLLSFHQDSHYRLPLPPSSPVLGHLDFGPSVGARTFGVTSQ